MLHSFSSVTSSRQEIEDRVAMSAPLRAGQKEMTLCSREPVVALSPQLFLEKI